MKAFRLCVILVLALLAACLLGASIASLRSGDPGAAALFLACAALVCLPTRFDPAIRFKERLMRGGRGV